MHDPSTTRSTLMFWLEIKPGGAVEGMNRELPWLIGHTGCYSWGECSIYGKRNFISWVLSWEGDLRVDCPQYTVLEFDRFSICSRSGD